VRTIAVTGSGSGIGAATAARLVGQGDRVIGVDLRGAEIEADLGTPDGRAAAVAAVTEACGGVLDGLITCAGISGFPGRAASLLAAVNYFGTVEVMEGLRPLLAASEASPSAVAISSNSTTTAPGYSLELVEALLAGDEPTALEVADTTDSIITYAATKLAVARWVRRSAVSADWAGAGIRLNAIAPGMIATPMIDEGRSDEFLKTQLDMFEQTIALGRPGRPEEIAALLAFLVGTESTFFCGSILFCDGGTDAALRTNDWPARWEFG
jgi:NAD(P)-dependent dehydrogenase (short-subunit alcohol dehydrogenase family)